MNNYISTIIASTSLFISTYQFYLTFATKFRIIIKRKYNHYTYGSYKISISNISNYDLYACNCYICMIDIDDEDYIIQIINNRNKGEVLKFKRKECVKIDELGNYIEDYAKQIAYKSTRAYFICIEDYKGNIHKSNLIFINRNCDEHDIDLNLKIKDYIMFKFIYYFSNFKIKNIIKNMF